MNDTDRSITALLICEILTLDVVIDHAARSADGKQGAEQGGVAKR
jgi:hypothetical protein